MSRKSDGLFLALFAGGLLATGVWILGRRALDLPLRTPGRFIHLTGGAKLLFAGGPMLVAATLALAARRVLRGGELAPDTVTPVETACFLGGVASLVLGVLVGR
jgi:hypothetical protein